MRDTGRSLRDTEPRTTTTKIAIVTVTGLSMSALSISLLEYDIRSVRQVQVAAYNDTIPFRKRGSTVRIGLHHMALAIGTNDIKPSVMAPRLKRNGCLYYWDNDYSNRLTDFLMTGRDDAINAGMKILSIRGDINAVWFSKRAVIYKGNDIYRYSCSYTGKAELKASDLAIVKTVLKGDAGAGDARISYLLDHGYNPGAVQKEVNEITKLVKG